MKSSTKARLIGVGVLIAAGLFGFRSEILSLINERQKDDEPLPEVRIDAPEQVQAGDLCVCTLMGADRGVWKITPEISSYCDSHSRCFVFAPTEAQDYVLFCSTVKDGTPMALMETVKVGGQAINKKDKHVVPDGLAGFVREKIPDKSLFPKFAQCFVRGAEQIEAGLLTTDAAAFAFVSGRLASVCPSDWFSFFDDLTKQIKAQAGTDVNKIKDAFREIAGAIEISEPVQEAAETPKEKSKPARRR